ncbi:MAG: thiamine pyrophosphate-dependent dehydrogenase E1 component subunit alpha [Bdellovibrionales bacterium]|nr:thiamine pyrophosphate-dependent dehydrogenase E1 component subunit alpha [Bdellovibrionales bacterium]
MTMAYNPIQIYKLMAKARALEERLIKMSKSDDGFFWIGGPGEEAFNVPLGLLIKKGEGLAFDFLHFHYRNSATLIAMGVPMIDPIRQMHCRATDPYSKGRNFVGHFAIKEWNVMGVTSPIEVQYSMAPGTAWAQKRYGGDGITVVTGGDAGSAEGDFATCLSWSNIKNRELPILIIVTNNRYGISTPFESVHGDSIIARRAEAFGIQWDVVDGNDPKASYEKLQFAMGIVREERRPFCLEAQISRLHGHSSSSGANREQSERDCLIEFEKVLVNANQMSKQEAEEIRKTYEGEALDALKQARTEPLPESSTIYEGVFK